MQFLIKILPYFQVIFSILLIISILLQNSGSSVGGALGGSEDSFHKTRRGFEKFLFYFSIICAILFALSSFLVLILK